ncbi:MFS transporter [Nonomuraea sp. SMC257]|uniref:MFS transporter n=1 Tax=Nonomuraea montanisoli TaxID=2741721 RepID=A0A7Y6IGI6_9ACTN|nr:MFS transporter [Nonomuraea montanisoli]NUW37852.1 MFS transporter [Nonomuraea montanisoli]
MTDARDATLPGDEPAGAATSAPEKSAAEAPGGIRSLLGGNRNYRRLLSAGLISQTGDWVVSTGLAYHVYVLTGSTLSSAAMLLAARLPDVLLGSLAGVLADRWDRRRLLVITDVLLASGLLPLLVVREPGQVGIVYAVALWTGVLSTVLFPAQKALVPQIVAASQLVRANALHGQSGQAARLLGALAGGVAVGAGGLAAVVWIGAAGFLISALLLARLRTPARRATAATTMGGQWISGLRLARTNRGVRLLVAYMVITGVGEGIFGTLAAPFVADVLGGRGDAYGLFMSAQAVGGIAGGLAIAARPANATPRALLGWGTVAFGLADLALFTYPLLTRELWPAIALIGLAGIPAAAAVAGLTTFAQTATGGDRVGAVFGILVSAQAATSLLGTALAGVLGERFGIVPTLCLHAGGAITAGLLVVARARHRHGTSRRCRPVREAGQGG